MILKSFFKYFSFSKDLQQLCVYHPVTCILLYMNCCSLINISHKSIMRSEKCICDMDCWLRTTQDVLWKAIVKYICNLILWKLEFHKRDQRANERVLTYIAERCIWSFKDDLYKSDTKTDAVSEAPRRVNVSQLRSIIAVAYQTCQRWLGH